jgi:hypothetical protein
MLAVHASCPLFSDFKPEPCDDCRSKRRPCFGHGLLRPQRPDAAAAAPKNTPAFSLLNANGAEPRLCSAFLRCLEYTAFLCLTMFLPSLLLRPVAAAAVAFENCLSDSYINNVPTPLQWVPQWVDAVFNVTDPKHTLQVTMWGNVTGSFTNVTLPPPGSPDWTNPKKTDGKIMDEPEPNAPDPKLTTLHSKVDVLTYEPWSLNTNFCNTSLVNGSCPLAPVFTPAHSR